MRRLLPLVVLVASLGGCASENGAPATESPCANVTPQNYTLTTPGNCVAVWDTAKGRIVVELFNAKSPITANNFVTLARADFYDGTRFHRVIKDFMIQDGDPNSKDASRKDAPCTSTSQLGWGCGGPGYTIQDEFPCKDGTVQHTSPTTCGANGGLLFTHEGSGILSMANGGPGTGGSQYFITLASTHHLDGKHAIFGHVIEGMDVVEGIGSVATEGRDRPVTDVVIHGITILGL